MVIEDPTEYKLQKYFFFPLIIFGAIVFPSIVVVITLYPKIFDIIIRVIGISLTSSGVILLLRIFAYPAYWGYLLLHDDLITFNTHHLLRSLYQKRNTLTYDNLKEFEYDEKLQKIRFYPINQQTVSNWWNYELHLAGLPQNDINEIISILKKNGSSPNLGVRFEYRPRIHRFVKNHETDAVQVR